MDPSAVARRYREFTAWAEANSKTGVDGSGNAQSYIPPEKLRQYADDQRVGDLLGIDDKHVDIHTLQNHYLAVFFILVYITDPVKKWTDYFLNFHTEGCNDSRLPLPRPPDEGMASSHGIRSPFPHTPDGLNAWREFYKHQWRFLPLRFVDSGQHNIERRHEGTRLDIRHIIPITVEHELDSKGGNSSRLLKVLPHESSGLSSAPIVIKEYSKNESDQFNQEHQAYTAINNITDSRDCVGKYFLRYYGSFIQADKCVIILEYADRGTLLDLYTNCRYLPRHEEEARALWESLGMLFYGLEIIHRRGHNNRAIHQDIKPANIFVFSDPEDSSRLIFKLGDLDLSSISRPSAAGDTIGQDNHGSKIYSDPNITQWSSDFQGSKSFVTWAVDIWSLGCLFFEAAVWMATFERGRQEFREARVKQIEGFGRLADAGYRGTFHDGFEVLQTLREKLDEISEYKTPVAHLSHSVMRFVLDEMLEPQTKPPLGAARLRERFSRMLENHQPQSPVPVGLGRTTTVPIQGPPSWRITSPVEHRGTDAQDKNQRTRLLNQNSQEDRDVGGPTRTSDEQDGDHLRLENTRPLTISDAIEWMKNDEPYNERFNRIKAELYGLRDRDQVFVVDNSSSMWPHWQNVKRTVYALSYLVKGLSPRGFEVRMTNSPLKTRRRNCKSLFDDNGLFDKHSPRENHGECHMETVLSVVLPSVVSKAARRRFRCPLWKSRKVLGIDVYILTDAAWGCSATSGCDNEAGGVEDAIETAVEWLKKLGRPRTFLSIQFIRFGQDRDGIRRLRWLDNGIRDKMGGWDIVDTTYHEGAVRKMIIGPKSVTVDKLED